MWHSQPMNCRAKLRIRTSHWWYTTSTKSLRWKSSRLLVNPYAWDPKTDAQGPWYMTLGWIRKQRKAMTLITRSTDWTMWSTTHWRRHCLTRRRHALLDRVRETAKGFRRSVKRCTTLLNKCKELGIDYVEIPKPCTASWNLVCCTINAICKWHPRSRNFWRKEHLRVNLHTQNPYTTNVEVKGKNADSATED